jgi:hypothetical protein
VDAGAPYLILYGWDQGDQNTWSYLFYPRPELGGTEALLRNLAEARKLGAYPLAWFNGTMSVETTLGHAEQGRSWVAREESGARVFAGRWSLFHPFQLPTTDDNAIFFELDPSTGAGAFLERTILRFLDEYGFSGFEMDQGNKIYLSYAGRNPDLAFTRGYSEFYRRIRAAIRKRDPNGIMVGEGVSDWMNQYMDSSWIFEGGGLHVPTLSRLRYSLPWVTVPARAVATDLGHANRAFLMNAPLDIFDDLGTYPDYAQHLRRLHALKRKTANAVWEGEFSDEEGFALEASAGVLAKSYQDPAGKFLAVIVVNTEGQAAAAKLRFSGSAAAGTIQHYYLDGREEQRAPAAETSITLTPYDVQALVRRRP